MGTALNKMTAEEVHRHLRLLLRVLPEQGGDVPATLGALFGDERAIAHHELDDAFLSLFSADVRKVVRKRVGELLPEREAREALAREAEAEARRERERAERDEPDVGPNGRGWNKFPGGS